MARIEGSALDCTFLCLARRVLILFSINKSAKISYAFDLNIQVLPCRRHERGVTFNITVTLQCRRNYTYQLSLPDHLVQQFYTPERLGRWFDTRQSSSPVIPPIMYHAARQVQPEPSPYHYFVWDAWTSSSFYIQCSLMYRTSCVGQIDGFNAAQSAGVGWYLGSFEHIPESCWKNQRPSSYKTCCQGRQVMRTRCETFHWVTYRNWVSCPAGRLSRIAEKPVAITCRWDSVQLFEAWIVALPHLQYILQPLRYSVSLQLVCKLTGSAPMNFDDHKPEDCLSNDLR